jgi:DMSO/TMAO reductase YedYZ molybdopterin-dependent catalytic subunit
MFKSVTRPILSRRSLLKAGLASAASLPLAGCSAFDFLKARDNAMREFLIGMNNLTYKAQRLLLAGNQLAPEFSMADVRQPMRSNGSTNPDTDEYLEVSQNNFAGFQLQVDGLVERPMRYTLEALRSMPQRTQITMHNCVEGWSCIAKWQGVPLKQILEQVGVKPEARYVLFHCYDAIDRGLSGDILYYETIDLVDARHPQTILAHTMNDQPLPIENGAPLRVRVERQLGYKMAKYLKRIELISDFTNIGEGKGSYWADNGYEWFAGI